MSKNPLSLLLLLASLASAAAAASAKNEYKAADANMYLSSDRASSEPLVTTGVTHTGDSYFVSGKKAPVVYVEQMHEWLEPLTAPDRAPLGIKPDAVDLRDLQGDVSVQLPGGAFAPATDKMALPTGAVVKTGANGTAVVLFGGVATARLAPNSEAAVQQTVAAGMRSEQVDLHSGIAFAKVGTLVGQKHDFKVVTPSATAESHGGDFAVAQMSNRVDLFLASGAATLQANGKMMKASAFRIVRAPMLEDRSVAAAADAETIGAIFNFIPMANTKVKALHDSVQSGAQLSKTQKAYLGRLVRVPILTKLAYVAPPAPVKPVIASTPPTPAPVPATPVVSGAAPVPELGTKPAPNATEIAPATPVAAKSLTSTPETKLASKPEQAMAAKKVTKKSHKKKMVATTSTTPPPVPAQPVGSTPATVPAAASADSSTSVPVTPTTTPTPMIKPMAPDMQLREHSSSSGAYNPNGISTGPNSTVP